MNVGSLFSGIGGIDLGLERAGMRVMWQCEGGGDPNGTKAEQEQWKQGVWRRSVLREHFDAPCWDDVGTFGRGSEWDRTVCAAAEMSLREGLERPEQPFGAVDLVCGGFPCQDLSVAGRRRGLAGERSGLFFEFARVADALLTDGGFVLVENVPGLLSSQGGRDFAVLLSTLAELGFHDLAWRVLDSRYFGVPQRRRRVFILGRRARGRSCAEILLEPESGGGDFTAGREARAGTAGASEVGTLQGGGERGYRVGADEAGGGQLVSAFTHSGGVTYRDADEIGSLTQQSASETSAMTPLIAAPLSHGSNPNSNMASRRREDDVNLAVVGSLTGGNTPHGPRGGPQRLDPHSVNAGQYAIEGSAVRRLTPTECERLQGFPDGWTAFGPDSRRYAALGDAVTVNVSEWIGRRIMDHVKERSAA